MTDAAALALLERIAISIEALRADLRRQAATADARAALVAAIADEFGDAQFDARTLCLLADEDRASHFATTLALIVDLDSPWRTVSLGIRLKAWLGRELAQSRGANTYKIRGG